MVVRLRGFRDVAASGQTDTLQQYFAPISGAKLLLEDAGLTKRIQQSNDNTNIQTDSGTIKLLKCYLYLLARGKSCALQAAN